jgi:hypothetical protein
MAKTSSKTPTKKVAAKKPASTPKAKTSSLEKTSEDALKKLRELGLDTQLQSDLEWCLGSYRADQNPSGLYDMLDRSLSVFKTAKENKAKGVTAKLTGDIEKALKNR